MAKLGAPAMNFTLPDISLAYNPTGILGAYEYIRALQGRENASFMTAHDPDGPAAESYRDLAKEVLANGRR